MRLLVVGTSDVGALLAAHMADRTILANCSDVAFVAVPGGTGPDIQVNDGMFAIGQGGSGHRAFTWPASRSVGSARDWDVIVVSALGLVDTGYAYQFYGVQQGVLHECRPRATTSLRYLSRSCYRAIVHAMLASQPGTRFTRQLRDATNARLFIQPTPLLSSDMVIHDDWPLARLYEDARSANHFFTASRLEFLDRFATEVGADLLPIPDQAWLRDGFTPAYLMDPRDGVHGTGAYGRLVLEQVAARITAGRAAGRPAADVPSGGRR